MSTEKDAALIGLSVVQALVAEKVEESPPELWAKLAVIALGAVEDLIRGGVPDPEAILLRQRTEIRDIWAKALREKFPNG